MADEKKAPEKKVQKANPADKTMSVKDVLSKDKSEHAAPGGEKKGKKKIRHTHVEHHGDGSATVRHTPEGGGDEISYSRPDLESALAGIRQNVGGAAAGGGGMEPQGGEEPPAAPPAAGGMPGQV